MSDLMDTVRDFQAAKTKSRVAYRYLYARLIKAMSVGEAKEVLGEDGLVDLAMNEIEVSTTPRNIPDEIVIDVSDMTMDTTITVGEVPLPAGVVAIATSELPVVTVLTMRTPVLDEEDAAAEALAEGEEGEGLEGEEGEGAEGGDAAGDNAGE